MAKRTLEKRRLIALATTLLSGACGLGVIGSDHEGRQNAVDPGAAEAGSPESSTDRTNVDSGSGVKDASAPDGSISDAEALLVVRLNINGPLHVGVDYPGVWTESPVPGGPCGPSAYTASRPLSNTNDEPLFAGEAFGNPLLCTVGSGLASGRYRVNLYFAEIYFGPGCPGDGGIGSRVFDVFLEDTKVLSNLDVFALGGGCLASTTTDAGAPIMRSFEIMVDDGKLDIRMPATQNNAKLSALELFGPL